MQKYLDQLMTDMRQIGERVKVNLEADEEFDPIKMMEMEESPYQPMGVWFGLSQEQFPPSESLSQP